MSKKSLELPTAEDVLIGMIEYVTTPPVTIDLSNVVGKCPRCGKFIGKKQDGSLRVHGPRNNRCSQKAK